MTRPAPVIRPLPVPRGEPVGAAIVLQLPVVR